MKMKKILSVLLCLIMLFSICSVAASAENYCEHTNGFEWVTTMQTCKKEGKKELVCRDCGYVDESKTEIIPAHDYSPVYVVVEATCKDEGIVAMYCSWCHTTKNVNTGLNPDNHKYGDWYVITAANCKDEGVQGRTCTLCKYEYTTFIPRDYTKHIAAENAVWETVTAPGCNYEGEEKTLCTVCDEYFTRAIPTHRDVYDGSLSKEDFEAKYKFISSVEGTCSYTGSNKYYCQLCSKELSVATGLVEDNHKYSEEWIVEKLSTSCTSPGVRYKYCLHNGSHKDIQEYTLPHNFTVELSFKAATECFGKSERVMQCENCSAVETQYVDEEHVFGDWKYVDSKNNCSTGGAVRRVCACSQAVVQEKTAAAGEHLNYTVILDTKPTCEYLGYQDIKCKDCNKISRIFPEDYKELGHKISDWITVQEATCENSGKKIKQCERCSKEMEMETIVQQPHSFGVLAPEIPATCTKDGVSGHYLCTKCGYEVFPETLPKTGHNFIKQNFDGSSSALVCNRCYEYKVDDSEETCDCMCHNSDGIAAAIYKIITAFNKLFGKNQVCECGKLHYEGESIFQKLFGNLFNKK